MAHGAQSATDARAILQYLDTVLLGRAGRGRWRAAASCGSPRCPVAPSTAYQPSSAERAFVSSPRKIGGIFADGLPHLERFQAKWKPVRVKKTRQIKNLEPRFDSIEAEKALAAAAKFSTAPR
jgi:hypothetical protein